MDTTIAAERRTELGKGPARRLRAAGKIPGVMYHNGAEAIAIALDPHRLEEIFRKSQNRNTILDVELEGQTYKAIVKDAVRHPVTRVIEHIDLYLLDDGAVIEVMVPLRGVGRPAGAAVGGQLELLRRELRVRARFDLIPEAIEYDVRPMEVGDVRKASEIAPPEGVTLVYKSDFNALRIVAKRASKR